MEKRKKHYFINEIVEWKLTRYIWTGCTNVILRDSIMEHANELIIQLIRKQGLFNIYRGHDPSAFNELVHVAYMQIERTLYKYRAQAHCRMCFSWDRPNNSILYKPAIFEFGIIQPKSLASRTQKCPHCGAILNNLIPVEPEQGLYGGSRSIMYRGLSKVFNMWCIAPDSLLITNNGIEEIGDTIECLGFKVDNAIVGNHNRDVFTRLGFAKSIKYATRRNVAMLKVTTKFGYNVRSSFDHQYMVLTRNGVEKIKACDLAEGMLLGVQYNQQQFGNNDNIDFVTTVKRNSKSWEVPKVWNSDLAYIVGLLVSEGYFLNKAQTKVAICNTEIAEFINSVPCGIKFKLRIGKKKKDVIYQSYSKVFAQFVSWLGIKSGASTKQIPKQILKCSKPIVSSFLRGLFDGDGHSKIKNGTVGYSSSSPRLIDQLRVLLANFGVLTKLTVSKRETRLLPHNDKPSKLKTAYQLELSTKDSSEFYNQIGFNISRKQNNFSNLTDYNYKLVDQVTTQEIQKVVKSISFTDFATISGNRDWRQNICKKKNVTIETFDKLFDTFPQLKSNEFLVDRYNEYLGEEYKMIWVPIYDIQSDGMSDTVDIEIPATGEFIVNGVASSNSQVSRTVILAHVKKDTRDLRNNDNYTDFIARKQSSGDNSQYNKIMREIKEYLWFNPEYCQVVDALIELSSQSDPDKNFKKKLSSLSDCDRKTVDNALLVIRVIMMQCIDGFSNKDLRCVDEAIF